MAVLASQIVRAVLQELLLQTSEEPIQQIDAQDVLFYMNNYMLDLDANGVSLGYTFLDSLDDPLTVPDGAIRGIIANVAVEVATQFGMPVSPSLSFRAAESIKTLYKLGVSVRPTEYGPTVPRGSGNEDNNVFETDHFYPETQDQILGETGGNIGLEVNTNDDNGSS